MKLTRFSGQSDKIQSLGLELASSLVSVERRIIHSVLSFGESEFQKRRFLTWRLGRLF